MSLLYGRLFGQFLVEKGRLVPSRLEQALEEQGRVNRPFGVLALERGFLSAPQVEEIVAAQKTGGGLFGEIAVTLGFLGEEQVDALLKTQAGRHLYLGEWLAREGFIDYAELGGLLREFHDENTRYSEILSQHMQAEGGPWTMAVATALLRLFSQGVCGRARIVSAEADWESAPPRRFSLGEVAVGVACHKDGAELFALTLVLPRRVLLSLIFCLEERQTLDERRIRETTQDFLTSVALSACLSCGARDADCHPIADVVLAPGDALPETTKGAVRLGLTTSIGLCEAYVRGIGESGIRGSGG